MFLIYVTDLPDNLLSNPKLLAHDTSLFLTVDVILCSINILNDNLCNIRNKAFNGSKMSFNNNPVKQAHKVIFSRKIQEQNHPEL